MNEPTVIRLGRGLRELGLTVATAESCTGGLVSSLITDVAGSSDYFLGGAVTYANSAKATILGVDPSLLASYGAVSSEVAHAMAQQVRHLFGADIGVAVTGIAGPGGGTPEKPVGLTYIHLSAADAEWGERYVWQGDRLANKQQSAAAVLALLLRYVEQGAEFPGRDGTTANEQGTFFAEAPASPDADPGLTELTRSAAPAINPNEPIQVELIQPGSGSPIPRAFTWRGQRHPIAAVGRRWQASDRATTWQCLLVQTTARDTFELCYRADTGLWTVTRAWLRPRVA